MAALSIKYKVVIGGTGIPTGIFRDPGPEIPVFWVSRDKSRKKSRYPDLPYSTFHFHFLDLYSINSINSRFHNLESIPAHP
jgi:hypothetical protein